jgi:hypothetical protein
VPTYVVLMWSLNFLTPPHFCAASAQHQRSISAAAKMLLALCFDHGLRVHAWVANLPILLYIIFGLNQG